MLLNIVCENQMYVGDGYCDDENNNLKCNYDGGDCCLDQVLTDYCTICTCYENVTTRAPTTGKHIFSDS